MDADSNMVAEWSIGFADSLIKKTERRITMDAEFKKQERSGL